MATLRIAACQLNLNVGDLSGNKEKILSAYTNAQDKGSDIAVFTELAVSGYPPEDLLLKRGFVHDTQVMLKEICLLYTSPSPRDVEESRMPSSA